MALMIELLREAGVFLQVRRPLAIELLTEDPERWPRQVLGWIAYTCAEGADSRARGATILPALKARAGCPDDRYLPPTGMPLHVAMAWARRGGAAEQPLQPAGVDWKTVFADDGAEPDAIEALWAAALKQLALELPPTTYDTRLRGTYLVQLPLDGQAFALVATNHNTAEWMEHRLRTTILRTLASLGATVTSLQFVTADQLDPLTGGTHAEP